MATYPNSVYIVTASEVRSLANIPTVITDAQINALIPSVQDAIEVFCDRRFIEWTWNSWFPYDRALLLPQYPVQEIMFLGTPVNCVQVIDNANRYSFDIKQANGANLNVIPKLSVIDCFTFVVTDFLFSTYTNVHDLVTAVAAAFPALNLTISTSPTYDFNSMNTLSLRAGTGLNWYGAVRQNVLYRIDDETSRMLIIPQNVVVQFNSLDYWFEVSINVVWKAGYTQALVPGTLKFVAAQVINDIINISKTGSGGILKSETITNYSYTMFDHANLGILINEKYAIMLNPYKKLIC